MVRKDIPWKLFYIAVIVIFGLQILYCLYQFLIVWNTGTFLLFQSATEIPFETMVTRRLYAIELWISVIGLVVFIAIVHRKNKTDTLVIEEH